MLHHETSVNKRQIALTAGFVGYTYAKSIGLDFKSFKFRILPRSLQTIGDKWIGHKTPIPTGVDKLDKRLSIYSDNEPLLKGILSARIQADLLLWAEQKTDNRVSDIRNYDDNLIFAVAGALESYEEYKLFLDTACRFFDAVTKAVSKHSNVLNDI